MVHRKDTDPSPFRTGLLHGFLSVAVFGAVSILAGGAIHLTGDPAEAGPRQVIALFGAESGEHLALHLRMSDKALASTLALDLDGTGQGEGVSEAAEPSLGIADPGILPEEDIARVQVAGMGRGIRINGKLVAPGQRFSQIEQDGSSQASASPAIDAVAREKAAIAAALSEPERVSYARPFENPDNKPIVSLIIGGLGTSYKQTISAIDELPPEVTLSFISNTNRDLLQYARRKGHEVLLEVPMESLGASRARANRDTLLANAPADENLLRLKSLLRGKREIYGVISYKGDKFVSDEEAAGPILTYLYEEGLAFFQHATLEDTPFEAAASTLSIEFAAAIENIDTETRASEIEEALFKLETHALDQGMALGTGSSYPLTVDLVSRWSRRLEDKGILLAPASSIAGENVRDSRFQTSQLDIQVGERDIAQ